MYVTSLGGLYLNGFIHGGAYFRNFTVILIFWGQKSCTRIISIILHPFLPFSRAINVISYYEITPKKRFSREPKKTNFKGIKFYKIKYYS